MTLALSVLLRDSGKATSASRDWLTRRYFQDFAKHTSPPKSSTADMTSLLVRHECAGDLASSTKPHGAQD